MVFSLTDYILAGLVVIVLAWTIYLHIKMSRLLKGKDAKSLEDTIIHATKEINALREFEEDCVGYFTDVERRLNRSVQAIETVRFNPFKGMGEGGNYSFSTALLSEKGDGVVVSSMYSRDRVGVFSKPLSKFQSPFELTEEEAEVIKAAKQKLAQ